MWCRISHLFVTSSGSTPQSKNPLYYSNGTINWVRTTDLNNGILDSCEIQITPKAVLDYNLSIIPQESICIAMYGGGGTIGKHSIIRFDTTINQSVCAIHPNFVCNMEYVHIFMQYQRPYWMDYAAGSRKDPNINQIIIKNCLIPIPPKKEQDRIVSKYKALFPLIDNYSEANEQRRKLNDDIASTLKKSILQEAIQGRLVAQDNSDEPASALLQRIKEEKQRLVKEGKLKKKDVVDSVIFKGDDNRYYEQIDGTTVPVESDYDFPSTWEVVRLAHICRLIDGEKREGQYVCLDAKYLRGKSTGDLLNNGKFVTKGDNIILVDGENSGEVFAVPHDGYMGSTFKQLWVSETMHLPYVLYFIQFYKDLLRNSKKGAAIPHLNKEIFYSLLIGIPPYQEQIRIANQIKELYAML
ncbi:MULTISPECIES: restriction endonuclease subunit S [unclassified Bacteroides]|uniref:restriction endonuclease subunit S n=1 Tax=Bacteroides sp. Ga6A1 TaxID=1410607 RepID=UPI001E5CD9F3|nr:MULTISPECIES: restriction endonuclease subunit S [unclassified Bacteroides]